MSSPADLLLQRPELEAMVVSVQDPEKQLRVQVRIFGLFDDVPDEDLPWATYKLPVGARPSEGDFTPVHVGDLVWIDFPYYMHNRKDTRRPRITGSVHHCPEGKPNTPAEAHAGETYQHKRSNKEPVPSKKPYHDSRVYIMHGIMVEYEQGGVYRVTHQKSGTAFEFDARGDSILHTEGNQHSSSTKDTENHAGKNLNETVGGYWRINVTGSVNVDAGGTVNVNGASIHLNKGKGVVQGDCICAFTGKPHSDLSSVVTAGK